MSRGLYFEKLTVIQIFEFLYSIEALLFQTKGSVAHKK